LGDLTGTFDLGNGITGTWEDVVVVDPFHTFCPTCLAFAFQVSLDPTAGGSIFALTDGSFGNFAADAGYLDQGFWTPTLLSRGGGITFNLIHNGGTPSATALGPGGTTDFLVIATNATNFNTNGVLNLPNFVFSTGSNGPVGHISGLFEPSAATPEPSPSALIALGFAAMAALRKRVLR